MAAGATIIKKNNVSMEKSKNSEPICSIVDCRSRVLLILFLLLCWISHGDQLLVKRQKILQTNSNKNIICYVMLNVYYVLLCLMLILCEKDYKNLSCFQRFVTICLPFLGGNSKPNHRSHVKNQVFTTFYWWNSWKFMILQNNYLDKAFEI